MGVRPHRRLAAFEGLRMVKGKSVGIFCRLELKKAVGGAHYDKAPPIVPDCRRTFNLAYFFVQMHKILGNLLTTAEKWVIMES